MGLFRKKADPISARSRALNSEIAALEAKIRRLDAQLQVRRPGGRDGAVPARRTTAGNQREAGPVFEPSDYQRRGGTEEPESTPDHFNELGVRKFDLPAMLRRVKVLFRGPTTHNPKLVSYLAAGSIKGLRPLRYEKRVARNRFIALFVVLVLLAWGITAAFFRR